MNKTERYDIRRFGARLGVFLILVSAIIGFGVICLYKAGELYSFSSYIHPLQEDQLFGLGYSYYDKSYKFHMTNEVEHPEVLALGSSRIMQVKRSIVSPDYSFYNAGGAIQNARELPLFISKLHDSPKLILVNIDQWWFNRDYIAEDQPFSPSVYDGEPELDIKSLIKYDTNTGEGYINILNAKELVKDYNLYSTFMLWMLNELYDKLPEVGDLAKPKLVFFIDEAHMLFSEMTPSMLRSVTQIVKLIRSKGVGLYFISQSPSDIPEEILAQLGNRIQHNLHAYTQVEQKNVKAAANSFRANPNLNIEKTIQELEIGEAVVSFINEYGQPNIAERAYILPPQSKMGVADINIINEIINNSDMKNIYSEIVDEESAYEIIDKKIKEKDQQSRDEQIRIQQEKNSKTLKSSNKKTRSSKVVDRTINSAASTIGRKIGNQIFKGLFK